MNCIQLKISALSAVIVAGLFPTFVSAQSVYEFKSFKQGLVVTPEPEAGLELSASAVNFGDVATNTTVLRQVRVSNPGKRALSFTAAPAVLGAAEFAAGDSSCGATLAAGEECLTEVAFSPTAAGTFNATLTFTSALAGSPHEVTLVGTAFNPVSLAHATLPKAMVGKPYSYDFKQLLGVSNETSPNKALTTWSSSGTLPAGLSFNTSTGVLTGTPSAVTPGASYTVIGTYKNNQGQQVYTIQVGEAVLEALQVSAGISHSCVVTPEGAAKCWGENYIGQLGDGTTTTRRTPTAVNGLSAGVTSISVGGSHTCALMTSGGVKCWGGNGNGRLGDNSQSSRLTPVDVYGLTSGVVSIGVSSSHSCALTQTAGVKCWGYNGQNQLGDGTAYERWTPVTVGGLPAGVGGLTVADPVSCVVSNAGAAYCWGSPGVFGASARQVSGAGSGIKSIFSGGSHVCAITSTGGAKCFGDNRYGQVGDNTTTHRNYAAVDVTVLTSEVTSFALGVWHTCAITTANAVVCWGDNSRGQLGDGTKTNRMTPVTVSGLTSGIVSIEAGHYHTCAVDTAGSVRCWGDNGSGQLGDGTVTQRTAPVTVLP